MNKVALWLSAFVLGLAFANIFPKESHAQTVLKVVKAYKTEHVSYPNSVGSSQIGLVVQFDGLSDAEWNELREAYVLADSTKAAWVSKGVGQSSRGEDGKVVTSPWRVLFFIIPKAASTFELQIPPRSPVKFQVPAAVAR